MNAERELKSILIPFYSRLQDKLYGGFYGRVDGEFNIYKKSSKGMVQTSRLLWFFSAAAKALQDDFLITYADHAYRFLTDYGMDTEHGGLYWALSYMGLDTEDDSKNALCQATAILAFSIYGKDDSIEHSVKLYHLLESKFFDGSGYAETFSRDFSQKMLRTRFVTTLLHIIEAYTALYERTGIEEIGTSLNRNLDILHGTFYDGSRRALFELIDSDGNPILQRSYGHEMECIHLATKAYETLKMEMPSWIMDLLHSTIASGIENNHMAYSETKHEAVYWVQAQTALALNFMFKRTGDENLANLRDVVVRFIEDNLVMKCENGEWYYDDTKLQKDIVSTWKGPYNNASMYLELMG